MPPRRMPAHHTPNPRSRRPFIIHRSAFIIGFSFLLAGCNTPVQRRDVYTGPTLPLDQLVARINQNNQDLPSLFARHTLEANIVHEGKTRFVNADGDLFVRKPRELYLRARKGPITKVFELGSTPELFWFTEYVDENTKWWGRYVNVGKPCAKEMPVRPDLFGEVLGVNDLDPNLLNEPLPTLQYNNDLDVYMLSWHARVRPGVSGPERFATEKQVFYDRATLLPRKVLLFDVNGRVVLRANLSDHAPVEVEGRPREQWPRVATHYDLLFPDTGSTMNVRLTDVSLRTGNGQPREGMISTIASRTDADVNQEIQIDADCE